jgi:hypothetical protein
MPVWSCTIDRDDLPGMQRNILNVLAATIALIGGAAGVWAAAGGPVLPMSDADLLRRLRDDDFTIVTAKGAGAGVMGAKKFTIRFADGTTVDAKWKITGASGDGWNNSPRREIGAYVVQQLFLDPDNYLVPPAVARCIPLDLYRPVDPDPKPNLELANTRCAFGMLSGWLNNVREPEVLYDRDRFSKDRSYAFHFANLNLLHYLIDHRDARLSNFLVADNPNDARTFSIDNGIAFGNLVYDFLVPNYNTIRVAAVPTQSVDRLRQVTAEQLDQLGVLGQLELDGNGVLRNVRPGPNLDAGRGERLTATGVQFGLTKDEIAGVSERLQALLAMIDAHKLGVF